MATLCHTRACPVRWLHSAYSPLWLETYFLFKSTRSIPYSKYYYVALCFHKLSRFLCLDKFTSKSTSGRQLHPQKGPCILSTGSLCSFATMNLGENGCHCCITYPTVFPGGACTSSWGRGCGRTVWFVVIASVKRVLKHFLNSIVNQNHLEHCHFIGTNWTCLKAAPRTSCKQQGKKQDMHLSGLVTVMISCPKLSRTWMVKERTGPQHCRLRQSFSSTA